MVESEKITQSDKSKIDVEKLIFRNFSPSDEGKYVCVRASGGANNEETVTMKKAADVKPTVTMGAVQPSTKPLVDTQLSLTCRGAGKCNLVFRC